MLTSQHLPAANIQLRQFFNLSKQIWTKFGRTALQRVLIAERIFTALVDAFIAIEPLLLWTQILFITLCSYFLRLLSLAEIEILF